jgi:hypothetical protein
MQHFIIVKSPAVHKQNCKHSKPQKTNSPNNMEHPINSLDMAQKGIPQPLAFTRPLYQAGNVGDVQVRRVHARRLPDVAQKVLIPQTP